MVGLSVLALGLRLAGIWTPIHGDEIFAQQASASWAGTVSDRSHPPGYYGFLLLTGLGGSDAPWLRLPSVVASVLLVPVSFLLIRRILNERVALLASLLLSLNWYADFWGIHARAYAIYALLAAIAYYAFLRARDSKAWAAAWGLSVAAGLSVHYFFAFLLLPMLLLAPRLWGASWWRVAARGGAVAAPVVLPWFLLGLPGQLGITHGETAALAAQGYLWPPVPDTLLRALVMWGSPAVLVGLGFAALAMVGLFAKAQGTTGRFLPIWFLLPLAAGVMFSYLFLKPVEIERMLFPLQVPFLAAVASTADRAGRWGWVAAGALAVAGFLWPPGIVESGDAGLSFVHGRLPLG